MTSLLESAVPVCRTDEVWEGAALRVHAPGLPPIAVFNLDGQFFAIDDTCTHGDASLADGYIENGEIECPYHQGRFCIRTGEPTAAPCDVPVRTYPVQVVDGRVFISRQDG